MTISFSEDEKYILEKIQSYCQYQERCIKEVRNKLFSLKATNKTADKILQSLIDNDWCSIWPTRQGCLCLGLSLPW